MNSYGGAVEQSGTGVQVILGIDPGLSETGWALLSAADWVVGCGSWKTDSEAELHERTADIGNRVLRVLCAHSVSLVVIEKYVFRGPDTNWKATAGTLRVIERVRTVCEQRGVPVLELTPAQAKKRMRVIGKPTHDEVATAFRNVPERTNEHGRDAVILAWVGWESGR